MSRAVRYKKHLTTLQVFLSIVLILLTACVAVKAFFLKAPEQKVDELPSQPSSTGDPQLSEEEQAAQKALRSHLERKGGFYTILVAGSDDGNGNSDTNILVAVDTVNGYVYGVSIPRDSKAVWDGKSHKINAAVAEKEKGSAKGGGNAAPDQNAADDVDELLPAAIDVVMETGQASVSMLQRRLKLGYSRAARIVDEMETRGIVGPFEGSKPRQLLITKEQWQELKMKGAYGAAPPEAEELPPPDEEN